MTFFNLYNMKCIETHIIVQVVQDKKNKKKYSTRLLKHVQLSITCPRRTKLILLFYTSRFYLNEVFLKYCKKISNAIEANLIVLISYTYPSYAQLRRKGR
jgi:hypothetical protein